ncbi:hypothetical protein SMZ38_004121 [Cronobacter turicensis]|uniref:hypothetical protein n=1 Tax=Cronobacter sakazakii TaxID=28141 RepID=UPI000DA1BBD4|nr:hypothetical protein [Cronobacter sakazakii]ELY4132908.1 hypothetical protein [Cronobacter turicensis]ELY4352555.1 hypothetical protein [Cronobacter turicensis]ELY6251535.1 hypothetical protein [Cronobacter sakazakii]ELY6281033.1 hypothetical protein [Cronobacter turicensis]
MSIKLTENRINTLLSTLNDLICEEGLLTREQRENMVMTVATIGGLNERIRQAAAEKEARKQAKAEKPPKKPREPDLVFPRSGKPWASEDLDLIHGIIDGIPDEEIDNQVLWLSEKQGRTPYAIALKIVSEGRLDEEWAKRWQPAAKEIREKHAQELEKVQTYQES